MRKVFGIGLSKTGTVSLTAALTRLGYRCRHYPHLLRVIELAGQFDALTDSPVISYMELLDRFYPEARFILTVREINSWLASCERHFAKKPLKSIAEWKLLNRRAVYGRVDFERETFLAVYRRHLVRVTNHFADRPGKLLIMDICSGDGYEQLCPFLGLPILTESFPYKNKG